MPISATIDKTIITDAAHAEGLKPKAAREALAGVQTADLLGIAAQASDHPGMVDDLDAWRAAFPAVFGSLDDATAWYLIRVAIGMRGGVVL